MSQLSLPAFLHCGGASSGRSAGAVRSDVCWPAREEAQEVIEYCTALHLGVNLDQWYQPGATSMAHVNRSRNTPGAISAQTHLNQLFWTVCENVSALAGVTDGTKFGNLVPLPVPVRTVDRAIMATRQFNLLQERMLLEQELQRQAVAEQDGGLSSSFESNNDGDEQRQPMVVDEFSDLVGPGVSRPDQRADALPQHRSNNPAAQHLLQRISQIDQQLERQHNNTDSLIGLDDDPGADDPAANDPGLRNNPFRRLDPSKPVFRFMCEIVYKDPDHLAGVRANELGEGIVNDPHQRTGPGADPRFRYDQRTGQVQYADINDVIRLFDYMAKNIQDPAVHALCEQNLQGLKNAARHLGTAPEVELPEGVKPYRLEDRLDEVDSFTFSMFTTLNFDPAVILHDLVTAADIRQAEAPGSALSSVVYDAMARQTEQLQVPRPKKARKGMFDPDVDWQANQNTREEGMERQTLRKPNRMQKHTTAEVIREMLQGSAAMTTERYMALAALYANDQSMMEDWLKRKREAVEGIRNPSSKFHLMNVFSFANAMRQRSPYCRKEQSLEEYTRFWERAIVNPGSTEVCHGYLYTDNIPNAMGVYSFVYPLPEYVLAYNPAAVKASRFLSYPLPHCSVERKHPLAERAPRLYEELANAGSGASGSENRRTMPLHDLSAAYDDTVPQAERERLLRHERSLAVLTNGSHYCMANMAAFPTEQTIETYVQGVRDLSRLAPELTTPLDLSRMTSSAVQMAVQELSRRTPVDGEFSHVEVAMDMAKSLSAVVLAAIGRVPGQKRRAALMHAHSRAIADLYQAECDPHQPDSDAFQAIQWCKLNDKIYSGERRIRPERMAPHLPGYANLMIFMSTAHYYGNRMLHARHITKMFLLSLTACTNSFGLLPGIILKGDGGVSKSKSMVYVAKQRVGGALSEGGDDAACAARKQIVGGGGSDTINVSANHPSNKTTSEKVTDKTDNAFTSEQTFLLDHKMLYREEMDAGAISGQQNGGKDGGGGHQKEQSASSREKDMLSSGLCTKLRLFYQSETGQATMKRYTMFMRCVWMLGMNGSDHNFEDSWHQRFLSIWFPKPKEGEPNPINRIMSAAAMPNVLMSESGGGRLVSKQEITRLHNEVHCFTADLFNLLEMRAMEPVNECVAWLIIGHLDDWMRHNGGDGLHPRQLSMIMDMARILLFQDLYASEVLFPGGRMYGQDWTVHDFLKLDPLLYIAPDHIYTALGMLHTHMCTQGRRELGYAVRYYVTDSVDTLIEGNQYRQKASDKQHYYLVDHIFAVNSMTYGDKVRSEQQQQQQQQQSRGGAFSQPPAPPAMDLPGGGSGLALDPNKCDYSFFDLDYVILRIPAVGTHAICNWLCDTLKNTPEVQMIPPARSLVGSIEALTHTNIKAYPMRPNVPRGPLEHGKQFGIRQTPTTVPLVVPDTNRDPINIPICQFRNGRLLVSTYFLQRDVSNEELMVQAIQALNNHANEHPMRKVLYGDHEINPHYNTITVGRYVKPGTDCEERDLRRNPEAFENLRLPNPQRMTQGVKDVMMGGAMAGMSPEHQRARVELLARYRGSPLMSDMLQQFEQDARKKSAEAKARGHNRGKGPAVPESDGAGIQEEFVEQARREVEQDIGRALEPGEFEEDVRVLAHYAQTQHCLLTAEQTDCDKIEIDCPLSDLARQMRAQQINLCPGSITRSDVEFAVNHFADWQARCKDGAVFDVTPEEHARFGRWEDMPLVTGLGAHDEASRPARIKRHKRHETEGARKAKKRFMDEYAMDPVAANSAASDMRSQAVTELPAAVAPTADVLASAIGKMQLGKHQQFFSTRINSVGTLRAIRLGRVNSPVTPVPDLATASGDDYDQLMMDASADPDADMETQLVALTQQAEAKAIAEQRQRRLGCIEKRSELRDHKHSQEQQEVQVVAQTTLADNGALVCTPADWLYDVQLDPTQFAVRNPHFTRDFTVDPFCNAPYVPDWSLKGRPDMGHANSPLAGVMDRRALYKLFYAYSPQWQINRANAFDPSIGAYNQRSTYPEYMVEQDKGRAKYLATAPVREDPHYQREQDVALLATPYSHPRFSQAMGAVTVPHQQQRYQPAVEQQYQRTAASTVALGNLTNRPGNRNAPRNR